MFCGRVSAGCVLGLLAKLFGFSALGATVIPPLSVTLAWNPSTSTVVAGYRLYSGTASHNYTNMTELGEATRVTVSNLTQGVTYYFAVTAYDPIGLESTFSGEISYTVPALTPLESWRYAHFGTTSDTGLSADDASPAGDGIPNLMKYALGLDPFTPSSLDRDVVGSIQILNGQRYLTLTVNRAAKASDVTYLVQVAGGTNAWTSGSPNTVTTSDTATQLAVRDATPIGSSPRSIRLAVTNP